MPWNISKHKRIQDQKGNAMFRKKEGVENVKSQLFFFYK